MGKKISVTFETKCYEKDWEFILKTPLLSRMISNCNFNFDKKVLIINNVRNRKLVERYAQLAVKGGIIDKYYFAEDYEKKALNFFGIKAESFKGGYGYSISELVSIYLAKTDYLLHFSSDSLMISAKYPWIEESIKRMEKNKNIFVANPSWTQNPLMLNIEAVKSESGFDYGFGFSDQCYLIRLKDFKRNIYNEHNPISDVKYPFHGGELFEKRVNAYMRNHHLFRITCRNSRYSHKNFPKSKTLRQMEFFLMTRLGFTRVLSDYTGDIKKIFLNRYNKMIKRLKNG